MLASQSVHRPTSIDELISPELAAALDRVDLVSKKVFAGRMQGERRSKARGRSVEFEDYRQYVAGDDLRHIDWNVFARLDRFFIKVFLEEQDLSLQVVLDASASMDAGTPNKLIFGERLAMALAYLGLVNNNRVGMWVLGRAESGPALRRLPPLRGRNNTQRVADFLLKETFPAHTRGGEEGAASAPSFSDSMRTIAMAGAGGGKGVLVVISDMLVAEGYEQGLAYFAGDAVRGGRGWDVAVMQVLSPGELDPAAEVDGSGGPIVIGDLRLTDAESGRVSEVTVTRDLLKRYRERLEAYQAKLSAFSSSLGMMHTLVRSDSELTALVLMELRKRGLLR